MDALRRRRRVLAPNAGGGGVTNFMPYSSDFNDAWWNSGSPAFAFIDPSADPWGNTDTGAMLVYPGGTPSSGASFTSDVFTSPGGGDICLSWYVKRSIIGMTGDALVRISNSTESLLAQMSWNYTGMVPSRVTSSGESAWDISSVAGATESDWYRMYLTIDGSVWQGDNVTVLIRPYDDDLQAGHGIIPHGFQLENTSTPGALALKP